MLIYLVPDMITRVGFMRVSSIGMSHTPVFLEHLKSFVDESPSHPLTSNILQTNRPTAQTSTPSTAAVWSMGKTLLTMLENLIQALEKSSLLPYWNSSCGQLLV